MRNLSAVATGLRRVLNLRLLIVLLVAAAAAAFYGMRYFQVSRNTSEQQDARAAMRRGPSWKDATKVSPRGEFLEIANALSASSNPFFGTAQVSELRRRLKNEGLTLQEKGSAHLELSTHLLRLGKIQEAIDEIEATFDVAGSVNVHPETLKLLHQIRALCYLRQAEVSNCIERHNRDCCLFPLARGGIHEDKTPAREARRSLLAVLESDHENLQALWLLNVVSMAVGDYPDGVPERYRIPPSAFESQHDIKPFVDIAPQLGVHTFNLCGGVIVDDFNGDGLLDIVTSTYDLHGPLTYYANLGDGRFDDRSAKSGLDEQLGGLNCVGADYDNDGDTDILVLRGAWLFDDGRIRNSLLRNDGDGTFTDVTRQAGLAEPACPTQAAVWGDFDNDGDLDLYVANESRMDMPSRDGDYPSQLFRNNGDGTFTDVARSAGVKNDRYGKGVATGDYDNDGDLDLYVSNVGINRLYRNNGDMTFTDVAEPLGVTEPEDRSFAAWFFDYDNDGWLDLFVAAYQADIDDIAADYLGQNHEGVFPCLYHNEGNGQFTNVTKSVGLDHPYLPMGANFGDLDNDGYLDIYLATGDPSFETLTPNIMLRNDAGRRFQDVTTSGGFGHLQKGHGVAFADIDNDGDQDIYHQLGGFYPGDRFHNALFQNPGHGNHFVVIELAGSTSNRAGYGARIRVTVDTPQGSVTFHRAVGSVSSFGGSPARQEIGLGKATAIKQIEIDWPASGFSQVVTDVPLDHWIQISENKPGFRPLPFQPIELK